MGVTAKMETYRGAKIRGRKEIVNQRRPKEKGALMWAAAPLLQWARLTPEQPGLSSLWEALAQRAQAGPGTQEVSGATAPLLPSLGDAAGRHPRLAGPTGTSALPAEGNRHKAAAHTMARALHAAQSTT